LTHFAQKVSIVTGASSGIGRALCRELHHRGAIVYAASRDADELARLAQECGDARLIPAALDVTDERAVEALIESVVAEHARLDIVVNNAGIVVGGDFEDMSVDAWKKILDVNLWGVIHGTQHAYAQMVKQGHGHIVNTASSAGVLPVAKSTAYAATKHAVVGLSTSLREEARRHGVRVSVAIPGLVDTAIFKSATNLDGYDYDAAIDRVPIRKISPEAAARATLEGIVRDEPYIIYPLYNRAIVGLYRLFPGFMGWLINRDIQ
jgi:NADP-dependent 3-hydroxy acid dehydrogenase YdfG